MPSGRPINSYDFAVAFKGIHPYLKMVDSYVNMKTKIRVRDSLNIVYVCRPQDLLLGKVPSIMVAENSTQAFIIKAKNVHGDIYSYEKTNYINARTGIIVTCPIHGDFISHPDSHLNQKHGCHQCGKLSSEEKRKGFGAGWKVNDWKTAASKSKRFSGFKLYILKCWNDNEEFIKIGRTFVNVKKRYEDKNKMPYAWKIEYVLRGNAELICRFENCLKIKLQPHKYHPSKYFNGIRECFNYSEMILSNLLDDLNKAVGIFNHRGCLVEKTLDGFNIFNEHGLTAEQVDKVIDQAIEKLKNSIQEK